MKQRELMEVLAHIALLTKLACFGVTAYNYFQLAPVRNISTGAHWFNK